MPVLPGIPKNQECDHVWHVLKTEIIQTTCELPNRNIKFATKDNQISETQIRVLSSPHKFRTENRIINYILFCKLCNVRLTVFK